MCTVDNRMWRRFGDHSGIMNPERLRRLIRRQSGLFRRDQAVECGYSTKHVRSRVARGVWRQVYGPVLAPAEVFDTFCASRLGDQIGGGGAFGLLDAGAPLDALIARAMPR